MTDAMAAEGPGEAVWGLGRVRGRRDRGDFRVPSAGAQRQPVANASGRSTRPQAHHRRGSQQPTDVEQHDQRHCQRQGTGSVASFMVPKPRWSTTDWSTQAEPSQPMARQPGTSRIGTAG